MPYVIVAQRSNDDPYEFLLYEQYESEQAFRDHQQTPHFKRLVLERAVPMLARRDGRRLRLWSEAAGLAKAGGVWSMRMARVLPRRFRRPFDSGWLVGI